MVALVNMRTSPTCLSLIFVDFFFFGAQKNISVEVLFDSTWDPWKRGKFPIEVAPIRTLGKTKFSASQLNRKLVQRRFFFVLEGGGGGWLHLPETNRESTSK